MLFISEGKVLPPKSDCGDWGSGSTWGMLSGLVEEREGFREVWEEVWSVRALRPVLKMLDHVTLLVP